MDGDHIGVSTELGARSVRQLSRIIDFRKEGIRGGNVGCGKRQKLDATGEFNHGAGVQPH